LVPVRHRVTENRAIRLGQDEKKKFGLSSKIASSHWTTYGQQAHEKVGPVYRCSTLHQLRYRQLALKKTLNSRTDSIRKGREVLILLLLLLVVVVVVVEIVVVVVVVVVIVVAKKNNRNIRNWKKLFFHRD
jgi:hypothetical protein